jgi:hypothetical protein
MEGKEQSYLHFSHTCLWITLNPGLLDYDSQSFTAACSLVQLGAGDTRTQQKYVLLGAETSMGLRVILTVVLNLRQ